MEFWEYNLQKAIENIEISRKLYLEKKFGLSAFHAQQGLEIGIKAFCYKEKINKIFEGKNALKTHIPSIILIEKYFNYIIDKDNRNNRRNRNIGIESEINKIINLLEKLQKIFCKLNNSDIKKQVWKYSLGISDESKIVNQLNEIKKISKTIKMDLFEKMIENIRPNIIKQINKKNIKTNDHIKKIKNKLTDIGFSDNLMDAFFDLSSNQWKSEIESFVIKKGVVKSFDVVFKEVRILTDRYHDSNNKKIQNKSDPLQSLGWISMICSSIILAIPHEQIGRYPTIVDGQVSEKWYAEKHENVLKIIDDCEFGIKRIEEMI